MSLDIGLLISGAKERGELEGRVTTLIKEIKKSGKHLFGLMLGSKVLESWLRLMWWHCRQYYSLY